jgi:hypothetical protein
MNIFEEAANKIGEIAVEAVKIELALQGHKLTGALIDSVKEEVRRTDKGAIIDGVLLDYGIPVNTGVPASNVPFTINNRASRRAFNFSNFRRSTGSSKYIAGLQLFAKLRFKVSDKEALSIAFAIAKKHKKQGIPTKASKRFSKTGKRTGAIQDALAKVDPKIQDIIQKVIVAYTNKIVVEAFTTNLKDVKVNR